MKKDDSEHASFQSKVCGSQIRRNERNTWIQAKSVSRLGAQEQLELTMGVTIHQLFLLAVRGLLMNEALIWSRPQRSLQRRILWAK